MTTCARCAAVEIPEFFEGDHNALQACMESDHTCDSAEKWNQMDILDAMYDYL
jgi:hypothetical protein